MFALRYMYIHSLLVLMIFSSLMVFHPTYQALVPEANSCGEYINCAVSYMYALCRIYLYGFVLLQGKTRLFDSMKSSSYIAQDFEKVECNGNQLQLKYMYVALSDLLLV